MRGMRGFAWYHILFIVPVLGVGFGIHHIVRKRQAGTSTVETAAVTKPSQYHAEERKELDEAPEIASERPSKVAVAEKKKPKHEEAPAKESEDFEAALDATLKESRKPAAMGAKRELVDRAANAPVVVKLDSASAENGSCAPVEFRGDGPSVAIKTEEWDALLVQYSDVKRGLLTWLEKNRKGFPEKVGSFMERQILSARLERPPVAQEPDLAWRGVGVLTFEGRMPVIRIGSGFIKLAKREPARAKFELTRLVAQSFAPCEMNRNQVENAWGPLLQCLQVNDTNGCSKGSYSEAGWAVATTIASAVAAPGCSIPAFNHPETARCVSKIPFPVNVAEGEAKALWKESRR